MTRKSEAPPTDATYREFWDDVGKSFPDLAGAVSTDYYRANEIRLVSENIPDLVGCRILKTDLWDEAKNTRILRWATEQGAIGFGVDIAPPIAHRARVETPALRVTVADVCKLPFRDQSFDAIYSMGTIEHFKDPEVAVAELFRVLRPGGRAIIGVPNRYDPFLRPLMVAVMYRLGLYSYGFERSFSRAALRTMLERAGFEVVAESGILFIPGWLRILDLVCHSWCRPLAGLTGLAVRPFVWLDGRFASLRRHGYLIATVVDRPL